MRELSDCSAQIVFGDIDINRNWASASPAYAYPIRAEEWKNIEALETLIPVYRCPSAALPEHMPDTSTWPWWVQRRVPASYLGCGSGVAISQNGNGPQGNAPAIRSGMERADGVLYGINVHASDDEPVVSFKKIIDGTSKTIAVGEAVHDVETLRRLTGSNGYPPTEARQGSRKDHWYLDTLGGWGGRMRDER